MGKQRYRRGSLYATDMISQDEPRQKSDEGLSGVEKLMTIADTFTKSLQHVDSIRETQLNNSGLLDMKIEGTDTNMFTRKPTGKGIVGDWWKGQTQKVSDRITINEGAINKMIPKGGTKKDALMKIQERLISEGYEGEQIGDIMKGNKTFDETLLQQQEEVSHFLGSPTRQDLPAAFTDTSGIQTDVPYKQSSDMVEPRTDVSPETGQAKSTTKGYSAERIAKGSLNSRLKTSPTLKPPFAIHIT